MGKGEGDPGGDGGGGGGACMGTVQTGVMQQSSSGVLPGISVVKVLLLSWHAVFKKSKPSFFPPIRNNQSSVSSLLLLFCASWLCRPAEQ